MRNLSINLDDVLDLVVAAESYGYGDSVFYSTAFGWTKPLTDAEIEEFAASFLRPEHRAAGYTEEDRDNARERLRELRARYQK